jgi:putative ABC transport system permease protein
MITIDAGKVKELIGRRRQVEKVTTLKEKDFNSILEDCTVNIKAAPTQEQSMLIKYGDGATGVRIIGTTTGYPEIRNFKIAKGRFFYDDENDASARVAVIGPKVIDNLFNGTDPIGETIRINNIPFEIIGTLAPKGASYDGANEDEIVFIPLKTGLRRVFNVDYIKNIYVQVKRKEQIRQAEEEIRSILRENHRLNIRDKDDDFTLQNVYTAIKAETETSGSLSLMITGVAALSIIVGGVGILAIMLLSVKERTSEIGLRMAVGAKRKDIVTQFLLEAVLLSSAGGLLGVASGIAGTLIINHFTDFNSIITPESVLVSVIISCSLGIFFGVYPARKASGVVPIQALK